jgi:hypothetical protein
MKYQQRMSLECLCHRFKTNPHYIEWLLKDCTLNVEVSYYDGYYKTILVEVNSLDDVVQCILKYRK